MGFLENVISGFVEGLHHLVAFVILYTIAVFALGSFYGGFYAKGEAIWYPVYLLFLALFIYVLKEAMKPRKSNKK
jgi:hypothetical protein